MEVYDLKIPKKRVAVLVGQKGRDKRNLEKATKCEINVNSDGEVVIQGEDNLKCYDCVNVTKAIGRGCKPEVALSLLNENNCCEILDILDYSGKNKDRLKRIKARIIGKEGKVRKTIEKITDTNVVIYGKTVCIVGKIERVGIASNAVNDILKGAPHGPVYSVCERKIRELRL